MRKSKRILSILLGICLLMMPIASSFSALAEDSIASLEQQLEELEKQSEEYQAILDQTQSDIEEKEEYIDALVSKISVLDDKIELTHQSIDELNVSIEAKQDAIEQANEDIEEQMETLCSRLRTIYMAGSASDLEIIFGAKDFSDFIDKMQLVKTLSNYDKKLIDSINAKLDEINEQKAALEEDKAALEVQEASLEADQSSLNDLLEENQELLSGLYASNADAQSALEQAELDSAEIDRQIQEYYEAQRIAEEQAAAEKAAAQQAAAEEQASSTTEDDSSSYESSDNGSSTGDSSSSSGSSSGSSSNSSSGSNISSSGYTWPCPGFYYLSSEWNEDRGSYNHGAIDIAGSGIMGATVVAADGGTVISTYTGCTHNWGKSYYDSCGGGYGNYVMIDHGNGKITIYAHLSSLTVSTGQYVSKGQTVGYVGSTGNSTGPHLHFECRLNGVKYNPMLEF